MSVQRSGLAAGAVRLAKLLDDDATAASAAAAAMRELRVTLGELGSLAAPTRPATAGAERPAAPVDELERVRADRDRRRAGS